MPCNDHNAVPIRSVVSLLRALPLLLLAAFAAPAAFAVDSGDITVVSAKGEVHVTMKGAARAVRAGSVLELPASIRTGRDGGVELRQGATTVGIGPDTLLEFPALEKPGAPIDRIQQPRGNAFYDIGKREGRKLRVETPYLVGVVKGTQFNIAAQDESTTISLFEGLLEVRAADGGAVVDLKAGEIAARKRGDKSISVIRMDAGKAPATGQGGNAIREISPTPAPNDDGVTSGGRPVVTPVVELMPANEGSGIGAELRTPVAGVAAGVASDVRGNDLSATAGVGAGTAVADTSVSAAVDAAAGGVAVEVASSNAVNVEVVSASVDVGAAVSASPGGIAADIGATTSVDAGPVAAVADTSVAVEAGGQGLAADVATSAVVDAGPVSVAVDTGTSADLSAGGLGADLGADATGHAGPVVADLGTSAAVDVTPGNAAVAVDASGSLGVADTPVEVPAGLSAGVDVSTGTVDLGVSVAGTDLDLGVDLGLGDSEPAKDTGSSNDTPATDNGNSGSTDVGGLLDGLLRRPGRR